MTATSLQGTQDITVFSEFSVTTGINKEILFSALLPNPWNAFYPSAIRTNAILHQSGTTNLKGGELPVIYFLATVTIRLGFRSD